MFVPKDKKLRKEIKLNFCNKCLNWDGEIPRVVDTVIKVVFLKNIYLKIF